MTVEEKTGQTNLSSPGTKYQTSGLRNSKAICQISGNWLENVRKHPKSRKSPLRSLESGESHKKLFLLGLLYNSTSPVIKLVPSDSDYILLGIILQWTERSKKCSERWKTDWRLAGRDLLTATQIKTMPRSTTVEKEMFLWSVIDGKRGKKEAKREIWSERR